MEFKDFGDGVLIFPLDYPGKRAEILPGDLSKFTPYGDGVYGYQSRIGDNPFTAAPSQEASGGVLYFDSGLTEKSFKAFTEVLDISDEKQFAVFLLDSEQPNSDGYLRQVRVVSRFAFQFLFGVITDQEYENFPEQGLNIVDFLWKFIEKEQKRWGTSFLEDKEKGLAGLFGGDGDYAREELAFGFMVENEYHSVYRIWSRAWLVTK